MPRGVHKVKATKAIQADPSAALNVSCAPSMATKPTRTNTDRTDRRTSILGTSFLSRSFTELKLTAPTPDQAVSIRAARSQQDLKLDSSVISANTNTNPDQSSISINCPTRQSDEPLSQPLSRTHSTSSFQSEDSYKAVLATFERQNTGLSQSSSLSSAYSKDSVSVNSRASSIYSSGTSIYSLDECDTEAPEGYIRTTTTDVKEVDVTVDSRLPGGSQYQQCARSTSVRRQDTIVPDTASRERSSLAKKAALFKNSKLQPRLQSFNTSLPTWSMICRAAQASEDCYSSQFPRARYTAADSSRDIKAMTVDEQSIDGSRIVIVAIRGTQVQSLTDWTVNTAANPVKPTGFLDDSDNACHEGFLQVAKAMAGQVADQLQQYAASLEKPSLLFTGHSAGGAVAAILYSHMLSTSVQSSLIALADQFQSVNCITFGAPPLSMTPLPRCESKPGVFLAFANEGDPVLRLSNAAYFKTLARLMTASPPAAAVATIPPPVKVVRGSRGSAVYRQAAPAPPPIPWEELPLWATPAPSLMNGGDIILLRDRENGCGSASQVTVDDLKDVIFGDLAQHTSGMYLRRVKDAALAAMMG